MLSFSAGKKHRMSSIYKVQNRNCSSLRMSVSNISNLTMILAVFALLNLQRSRQNILCVLNESFFSLSSREILIIPSYQCGECRMFKRLCASIILVDMRIELSSF